MEEETGISLHLDNLINLTAFLDQSTGRKIFPSPVCKFLLNPYLGAFATVLYFLIPLRTLHLSNSLFRVAAMKKSVYSYIKELLKMK